MPTPTQTISPFVIAGERAAAAMRERDEADRAAAQAAFTFEAIGPSHPGFQDWSAPPGRTIHSHRPGSTWPRLYRSASDVRGRHIWVPDCIECAAAIYWGVEPRVVPSAPTSYGPVPTSGPLGPLGGVVS